eukprot:CAMPEP_0202898008 /NCGR_PEP_ID=MMETSP1392-20130828/6618_1 /ASSEMBLY_ACC=CAM_ASM_000868 /TAXON_ID=225041 /ORGANISM="Chlamydomonas chlamydogama, Strain SAG 11-48b" /LENGTH=127 /DNA_ID=CAMNT_0049583803 /DNA_START=56 /DNA_END=439 /DNA_ORIENTATION=-
MIAKARTSNVGGCRAGAAQRTVCVVRAQAKRQGEELAQSVSRRLLLSGLTSASTLMFAYSSVAKDIKEALAEKEARKKALREAAGGMKATGKDAQIFEVPEYSVSEEARTPNIHSRQGEGARTQENV